MNMALGVVDSEPQQAFYGVIFLAFAGALGVALIVSLLGILYMTLVVAPNATQRFTGALRERNLKSLLAGLPVAGAFGLAGAAVHKVPALAAIVGLAFGVSLVLAYAAAAEDIGRRLYWSCGKDGSRASHLAAGWLVFAFGSLFPVIGWFLIFPYVSLSGLGSILLGTFARPSAPAAAPASAADVEYLEK